MSEIDIEIVEESFFKRGNPLKKLLRVSLALLGAEQTGILYGTNHTKLRFIPTNLWDRGVMDRFDGRGLKGMILKMFGKSVVNARKLSPVFFYKTNSKGIKEETDGVIAYVLRNCSDFYRKGISVFICPDIESYILGIDDGYVYIPYYSYDGFSITSPVEKIKLDVRIVRHFKARNYISVYLPSYGILVANTADEALMEINESGFVNEKDLKKRLDLLIKLVETSSLAYLGQLKGKRGAELLWQKERALRATSSQLVENEKRYRDLYENAPVAYFSVDKDGVIIGCNQYAQKLCGYQKEEIFGKSVIHLFSHKMAMLELSQNIRESIAGDLPIKWMELQMKQKQGHNIWVNLSVDVIKEKTGEIIELRAIAIDITERKNLENRLIQSQKMEAVGTLAGGIAHDFNNLLSPIKGYTELLLMDAKEGEEQAEYLGVVLECANHARDLINQMLMFSRQKEPELKLVRVNKLAEDILTLVRSFLPATIRIHSDISPDCGLIMADPVQIHQVLMNLITNAFHAMEESGGALYLSVEELFFKENQKPELPHPGSYIYLKVQDTGTGMDSKLLNNIFDPYFTTKQEGKGTGLGLSVVHGIIQTHGGHIDVESVKGEGTTFNIYFPVFHTELTADDVVEENNIIMGTENILMVDDDEKVATMQCQILEKLGYHVTVYFDSIQALRYFLRNPGGVDLVITDLTMPEMTGVQLAQKIMETGHPVPIVLCTGFGEHIDLSQCALAGINTILKKPVAVREFAASLRKALDQVSII